MKVLDGLVPEPVNTEIEPLQGISIGESGTSLQLLQQVYRSPKLPLPTRMRAAIAAIQFEHPKLAVTASIEAGDFADQLDQAVERTRRVLMIEAKPITNVSSENASSEASGTKTLANGKPMIADTEGGDTPW
jgi:hypothetical protein